MLTKRLTVVALASAFALPSLAALADTTAPETSPGTATQAVPTAKLVDEYSDLAGSEKNAESLVTGLRTGSTITLEPIAEDDKTITFESPTRNLGNGEIKIVLVMADKLLSGDDTPTNQDLYNALMGDKGVLTMRAEGMGWGQIANALGFRLGEVMRSGKAGSASAASPRADSRPEKLAQRPQRPDLPDRAFRPERPMKPELPQRPGR